MVGKKRVSKFNISNKLAYTLIVILSIILIGVGVYAYGGSAPATMGHSAGELAPPAGCTAGQTLTWSGSAWACQTPSVGLTKGTQIYKCPTDPIASNYCANVQLTRNGIAPCMGQLATGPGGCYIVDANCAYTGFGTCVSIGYLVS